MHPLRLAAAIPLGALALTLAATPAAAWPGPRDDRHRGDAWHARDHDRRGPARSERGDDREPGTVSVTGRGESSAAPDMATITLGVTVQAPSAGEAMRQNTARQQTVIDTLRGRGIEGRDIQTSGLSLTPLQDFSGEGRPPVITGYQATNMVTVRVRDLPRLGEALDALVGAGANEIHGIGFQRENLEEADALARARAVVNARLRAGIMAHAAGMELGRIVAITDGASQPGPRPMMRAMAMDSASAPVPIEAGELSVAAEVTVTWELQPARRGEGRRGAGPRRGMGHDGMGRHGMEDRGMDRRDDMMRGGEGRPGRMPRTDGDGVRGTSEGRPAPEAAAPELPATQESSASTPTPPAGLPGGAATATPAAPDADALAGSGPAASQGDAATPAPAGDGPAPAIPAPPASN